MRRDADELSGSASVRHIRWTDFSSRSQPVLTNDVNVCYAGDYSPAALESNPSGYLHHVQYRVCRSHERVSGTPTDGSRSSHGPRARRRSQRDLLYWLPFFADTWRVFASRWSPKWLVSILLVVWG